MNVSASGKLAVLHSVDEWLSQTMTWLYALVKSLPASIDAHVICESTQNIDQFALPNIHALQGQTRLWDFIQQHVWTLHRLRRAHSYISLGRAIGARVLHSHFGPGGWADLGHARRMGVRHVVTFYGFDVNHLPLSDPVWYARYREMFAAVDLVLCEGPYFAGSVAALGCPTHKIKVQHLGVEVGGIRFEPRHWQPGTMLRILIAGAFMEKKGIPYALEALGELQREVPLEITLFGDANQQPRNQQEKCRILATIERCGLNGRVRLLGFRPHAELFQQAYQHHVFVSPSVTAADGDTEGGAPMTIIEMLATGMPVVSTLHCDIPGVIQHGVSGLLAPERDVGSLVEHLRRLTQHPQQWQAMAQAGRAHIEAEFNAAVQGARLAALYAGLAAEPTTTS